jgi:hypothetical protein
MLKNGLIKMRLIKYFYLCLTIFLIVGCNNHRIIKNWVDQARAKASNTSTTYTAGKHTLIVFVHGTILPLPSPTCIFPSIKDVLKKGRSEKRGWSDYYYEKLRYKTFFKYQIIGNYGLEDINKLSPATCARYPYTKMLCNFYENSYEFANDKMPANLHMYNFGWDGRLSQKSRLRGAKNLYKQLTNEILNLKNKFNLCDDDLEIIMIGHSHGGNVLLNLARAEEEFKQHLKIDKLILLATPVQSETADLISNRMFKNVYSFYSNGDYVQVIDIVSTEDSISKRRYKNNESNSKLVQIELTIDKTKPSHSEMWLCGNSYDFLYRKCLSTYPFPLFLFIPMIINKLECYHVKCCELLVNIKRDKLKQEFVLEIKNKGTDKVLTHVFVPVKIFDESRAYGQSY